ncbi:cystathionine beta-synthase [Vararia minispora EC-137]|uniref:Cystathionine beta-synthase n=1 Tax=Vararia minispora EC-137 TaxID=1314806 RepID=A0ACB8QKR1_9AGAM|nr:cystathionine beta-synthase [Vararia minispora EC-137]
MSSSSLFRLPILNSALDAIGSTPLIRLDRIAAQEGLKCNLLGKLESVSPAGSVKDRVAKRMVEVAEEEGVLVPGKSVVIEPTSGNTGIGLAMACAIKGYSVIVVMSQKASVEKETAMRVLGAEVVRVPIGLSSGSRLTHTTVAKHLQQTIPHSVILDQYSNPNNPLCHELGTAQEMIDAVEEDARTPTRPTSGKVDVFFASTGTGGTLTGVARGLKKAHNPSAKVIGIDVKGSLLAVPPQLNEPYRGTSYLIEGIGYDVIPAVLTREPGMIDSWVKTGDAEAFAALKLLLRLEGLLVSGSSGSALAGALMWLKSEEGRAIAGDEGKNVVVLLPGGTRNYIAKEWFRDLGKNSEPSMVARQAVDSLRQYLAEPDVAEPDKFLLVNSEAI